MLSPVVGQDIYITGQSIADLGETDKSWEWAQATRKPETERKLEKTIQIGYKDFNRSNPEANVVLPPCCQDST